MRITQGTFSYLPDLTDDEIAAQIQYAIDQGWAVAVEFTDDPHPRNFLGRCGGCRCSTSPTRPRRMHEVRACRRPTRTTTSGSSPTTPAWAGRPRR